MMTKKDHAVIASVIRELDAGHVARQRIATAFAEKLEIDNPRFNYAGFLAACDPAVGGRRRAAPR